MQAVADSHVKNPLDGLVSAEVYSVLDDHNLLSQKGVRDFQIRQRFRRLREENVTAHDAIESLRESYPYLQFDTLRKIVYKLNGKK